MLTLPDTVAGVVLEDITVAAALAAELRDGDGRFPQEAFNALFQLEVTASPPLGARQMPELLRLLAAVGRGDLSVGRIFEGHCNALWLIRKYGSAAQQGVWLDEAAKGGLFGVWNTDQPGAPLRLRDGVLTGAKSFSTGVDGLDRAIVTVEDGPMRQMIVAPLSDLSVDRTWWRPMGMRASGSHIVDFTGLRVEPDWLLGQPGDYVSRPWFSAGAMRFAAVQVGGMHALLDVSLDHLRGTGRGTDPYQAHRVGRMGIAVQAGYGWLFTAAEAWTAASRDRDEGTARRVTAVADAARCAVEGLALELLEAAERGVGAAGLIAPHPLERRIRDLRTYLRQPNPDGALASLGQVLLDGAWSPSMAKP